MGLKFCELASKAIKNGDEEEMWNLADDFVEQVRNSNPRMYEDFMTQLEEIAYRIPLETAERIVGKMRPKGQEWSYDFVKKYIADKGIKTNNCVAWYLVMNMCYNDYYDTANLYGLKDDKEFYFHLAKDFIEDPDGKPMKVEKYFTD